jgi:hypothetical protein
MKIRTVIFGAIAVTAITSAFVIDTNEDQVTAPTTTVAFIPPVNTTAPSTTSTTSTTTTTTIYVDPVETAKNYVNSLTYNYRDPIPAMEAFKVVAAVRGWTQEEIDSWLIAAEDIMVSESGFCPNLRRGAIIENKQGCVLKRQSNQQDSGFGQLIAIHYNSETGWLCKYENICSAEQIVESPWNSMTSLVALIEWSSASGWCYSDYARRLHYKTCNNVGIDVPFHSS